MDQQRKPSCVLFRTIVEAAKEMNKEEALELLLTYADYALGDTEEIETDNKYIKLILKQTIPALIAAENRYAQAVENGKKGKEHGKKGGRPKKGETKEEAYERRNPSKTPEQTPVETPENNYEKTPVKPHDVDIDKDVSVDKEEDVYIDNSIDKEKDSFEEFSLQLKNLCLAFIRKHHDYNYLLDEESFKDYYYDNIVRFQLFVNEQLKSSITIKDCVLLLLGYANEQGLSA